MAGPSLKAALLLCLALFSGPSAEAAISSHIHNNQDAGLHRNHLEVSSSLVHVQDVKRSKEGDPDDADDEEVDAEEKEVTPAVSDEKAVLQNAVQDAEGKIAGNEAEKVHIKETLKKLRESSASHSEMDERVKEVAAETGSSAMGSMFAKIWQELRMFELPSFTKHANKEISVLDQDKQDLEAKLEKAQSDLLAVEQPAKKDAKNDVSKEANTKSLITASAPELGKIDAAHMKPPPEHTSGKVNVWGMPSGSLKTVFLGSIVYLCLGILCAYLYNEARKRYPKAFMPEPRPEVFPSSVGFSFPLFEFWTDRNLCLVGCFCPFLRWSDTMDREGLLSYWKAFFSIFLLLLLHVYTYGISDIGVIVLGVYYRQKLRSRFLIESGTSSSLMYDCLAWLCCQPCAIIQEAREGSLQRGIEPV